jgi:hypothetical protein
MISVDSPEHAQCHQWLHSSTFKFGHAELSTDIQPNASGTSHAPLRVQKVSVLK